MSSQLLKSIPESYFSKTMGRKLEVGAQPLINTAVGIPDQNLEPSVQSALQTAVLNADNHKYGSFHGKETFRQAIQTFYKNTYNVDLCDDEICILYGTKNGLVQIPLSIIEPGEGVLLPNPGYTDYLAGVKLARGEHYDLPLYPENNYLPDFDRLDSSILNNTKLIYLNYPSNPTGAVATEQFFNDVIHRFKGTRTKVIHDFAYAAFGFDRKNPSILAAPGAKEVAIEVYSLSKGFNMSGVRVGFAVGNKEIIAALKTLQDHLQAGMWGVVQDTAVAALSLGEGYLERQNEIFKRRRDKVTDFLNDNQIPFAPLKGGIFLWMKVPDGFNGESFTEYLLKHESILVTPGIPFGSNGAQYVRISLAIKDSILDELLKRLLRIKTLYE